MPGDVLQQLSPMVSQVFMEAVPARAGWNAEDPATSGLEQLRDRGFVPDQGLVEVKEDSLGHR